MPWCGMRFQGLLKKPVGGRASSAPTRKGSLTSTCKGAFGTTKEASRESTNAADSLFLIMKIIAPEKIGGFFVCRVLTESRKCGNYERMLKIIRAPYS